MNRIAIAFSAAFAFAAPAGAQAVEEKHLASGKFVFDKDAGYIYLHGSTRQFGKFLKTADQADIDAYTKDWEMAFGRAKEKHAKQLAAWERERALAEKSKQRVPAKPVEPMRETFSIGDLELRNMVSFGPEFVFSKDKENGRYAYMVKVKPGTYTFYGPIEIDPNLGQIGVCYCMGSVQFEVRPGMITDLGNFLAAAPRRSEQFSLDSDNKQVMGYYGGAKADPAEITAVAFGLPASLNAFAVVQADFRAAGKMDNFYGMRVSRMPPIPGVLGYQRDKVVDLRAAPAAN